MDVVGRAMLAPPPARTQELQERIAAELSSVAAPSPNPNNFPAGVLGGSQRGPAGSALVELAIGTPAGDYELVYQGKLASLDATLVLAKMKLPLCFYYIELLEQKVDLTATPRLATPEPSRTDPNTPSALASTAQLLDAKTPGGASIDALPATPMVSVQREFCWLTNPAPPAVEVIDGRTILVEIGRTMQYGCEARRRALNGEGGNEFMTYQLEVSEGRAWKPSRVAQFVADLPKEFKVLCRLSSDTNAKKVSVSDLCPATWYHFRLRVLYSGGEVLSEVTSVATQCDVPDAPERVKAVVDKTTSVDGRRMVKLKLSWTRPKKYNGYPLQHYELQQCERYLEPTVVPVLDVGARYVSSHAHSAPEQEHGAGGRRNAGGGDLLYGTIPVQSANAAAVQQSRGASRSRPKNRSGGRQRGGGEDSEEHAMRLAESGGGVQGEEGVDEAGAVPVEATEVGWAPATTEWRGVYNNALPEVTLRPPKQKDRQRILELRFRVCAVNQIGRSRWSQEFVVDREHFSSLFGRKGPPEAWRMLEGDAARPRSKSRSPSPVRSISPGLTGTLGNMPGNASSLADTFRPLNFHPPPPSRGIGCGFGGASASSVVDGSLLGAPVVDKLTSDAARLQLQLNFPCNLTVVKRFLSDSRGMTRRMESALDLYSRTVPDEVNAVAGPGWSSLDRDSVEETPVEVVSDMIEPVAQSESGSITLDPNQL